MIIIFLNKREIIDYYEFQLRKEVKKLKQSKSSDPRKYIARRRLMNIPEYISVDNI